MTAIVDDIRDGFEDLVQGVLGSDWNRLQYTYTIEKNPKNTCKRFGVIYGEGVVSATGRIGDVTIDRDFSVILADEHIDVGGDENAQIVQNNLEVLHQSISEQSVLKKLGVPNQVYSVTITNISEPFLGVDGTMFITASYTVKYRSEAFRC